ncbi:FAD-dependent oxidoreductase [Amnibacterium flavum]|uniref:Oxidoreductase n=1 Tax=Amnibacterium flavum TaxID=2173173 RepID=A0A2V1HUZ6_9MICO|nr:oxidoreductase [Amnibacterium flavum]PVZ93914.1 oxidoreductase [Amnibacterium flavum]
MTAVATLLDRITGRFTMYRLMTIVLGALLVLALILSASGQLFYSPVALLASAAVAIAVTWGASRLLGLLFRVPVHGESSIITGLLVFFLLLPTAEPVGLAIIGLAALLAAASKFAIAVGGRHLLNPAAAGVFLVTLTGAGAEGWWVATPQMLPLVVIGAILVLWRTRTHLVGLTFMALATVFIVLGLVRFGTDPLVALGQALGSYPIVFLGAFMLSEPLTLPPRRRQQLVVAAVVAVLFALPLFVTISFGTFNLSQAFALLVGNLVAAALAIPVGLTLRYRGSRPVGSDAVEYRFGVSRPPRRAHRPGQYLELQLPGVRGDVRGSRRHLSIVSGPEDPGEVRVAVRVPERPSAFKRALSSMEPGAIARATWVGGDFVLPDDRDAPVVLIAGGIGVTPFVAELGAGRDAVLVVRARSYDELIYRDEIERSGARVVLVSPDTGESLPAGWTRVDELEGALAAVPDIASREAYVSGAPLFVDRSRGALRAAGVKRIRTDRFSGY